MQGIPDQSHCQLKLSGMGEGVSTASLQCLTQKREETISPVPKKSKYSDTTLDNSVDFSFAEARRALLFVMRLKSQER